MTSWSEIITNHAMVVIDDVRLQELAAQNPALFMRRMSLYVKNAIPLFSRPPQMVGYLLHEIVEPSFGDYEWTSTEQSTTEQTVISTGMIGYDLCHCEYAQALDTEDVYFTPVEVSYDAETGEVTIPITLSAGLTYSIDFYKDGEFFYDLTPSQKRILGLCVASVWDERFFRNFLNDTMKIKDQSFNTVNESNYMREGAAKKAKNRAMLNDELRKYEQDVAYRTALPDAKYTLTV